MDWKREAIQSLRDYGLIQSGMESTYEQIKRLEESMTSTSTAADKIPIQGGASTHEEKLVANIAKVGELRRAYEDAQHHCNLVEKALSCLQMEEEAILRSAYIEGLAPSEIAEKMNYSIQWAYSARDRALRKYTLSYYGAIHT